MEFCSNQLLESFVAVSDLEPGTANHFPCSPAQRTLFCKTSGGGRGQIVVWGYILVLFLLVLLLQS